VQRVQEIIADTGSPEIWWLRKNADYIASAGIADVETNIAILLRNLVSAHFVVGALLFAIFGSLSWLADAWGSVVGLPKLRVGDIEVSFWWWVPVAVLAFAVLPFAIGYWLTPGAGQRYPRSALLLWVLLLGSAVYGLGVQGAAAWRRRDGESLTRRALRPLASRLTQLRRACPTLSCAVALRAPSAPRFSRSL